MGIEQPEASIAPGKKNRLTEIADTIKSVCQAILWLVVITILLLALSFQSCRQKIPKMADDARLEEISVERLKFRQEVESTITASANKVAELTAGKNNPRTLDVAPIPQAVQLLSSIQPNDAAAEGKDFWVYIGGYDQAQKKYLDKPNFVVGSNPPALNSVIQASRDVYKRKDAPWKDKSGQWQLGKIIGVVKGGGDVLVKEIQSVEGDTPTTPNLWARVTAPPS